MISKNLQDALNKQIGEELYASLYYLSMASWCQISGLPGSAKFLYQQSEQERQHMMKLFKYVNDAGGHAQVPVLAKAPTNFKSIAEIFKLTQAHEKRVTGSINNLVDLCLKLKDYSTFNFLQWYVAEQHEEETKLNAILDIIKVAGVEGRGLFLIDKEIEKRADSVTV